MHNNSEVHHPYSRLLPTNINHKNPNDPLKHSRFMEILKETFFKLSNSNLNRPLTPSQISLVEKGLLDTFSSLKTPTHPTYASMVQKAIEKLDKEGSLTTEEIISECIIKSNEGLPWAHKRYLKHHLGKLCEIGELIYDSDGSYNFPGKKKRKRSRKLLRQRLLSDMKENLTEEGDLVQEEVHELNDSQVCFQEDASQELGRGKRKRRRKRSYIIEEEEDEDVETRVIVGEGNRDSCSEMVLVETQNEMLLLKGREDECENSELEQVQARNSEEVHGLVDFTAGKSEPKVDIVHTKEVKNQVVQVDHDLSEGRKEPKVSVLPAMVDDSNGDLLLSPLASVSNIESDTSGRTVEKSGLKERKPNPCNSELMIVPYVVNPENSAIGKEMIPVLKSVDPVIVCGLSYEKPETPKKKPQANRQRKRSKPTPEEAKALGEESILASLDSSVQRSLETKTLNFQLKRKSQSPKLKGVTFLEDGIVKQLEKQKNSHPIGLEIISMEDEEPLRQVIEKCGNRKKHGLQGEILKVASALTLSKAGTQLPEEQPSLENFVEMAPTVEKESALTKGTEKQLHVQLRSQDKSSDNVKEDISRKLSSSFLVERETKGSERPEDEQPMIADPTTSGQPDVVNVKHQQQKQTQGSCDSQLVTAATSEEAVPTDLNLRSTEKRRPKPKVLGLNSPDCPFNEVSSSLSLDGRGGQAERSQLQVSDYNLQAASDTLGLATESALDGGYQSIIEGPKFQCQEKPSQSKETRDGFITPTLLVELHQQEEGPSEPTGHGASDGQHSELVTKSNWAQLSSQRFEHQMEDNEGQSQHEARHQYLEPPAVTFVNGKMLVADQYLLQLKKDDQERPLKVTEAPKDETFLTDLQNWVRQGLSELASHQHESGRGRGRPLKSNRQQNKRGRGRPPKSNRQQNKRGRGRPPKSNKSTMKDAVDLLLNPDPTTHQFSDHQNKQLNCQGRLMKEKLAPEDASVPSSLHLHEQEGTTLAIIQRSQQKNESLKQDDCVRTRKQRATMKDAAGLLNPHLKERELLPEIETPWHLQNKNKQLDKAALGRPGNSKEFALETMDPSSLHLQEQQGTDPTTDRCLKKQNKQLKKDGRGRPRKQKEATLEAALGRPGNSKEVALETMDPSSLHLQEQQGTDPTTDRCLKKQNKQLKKDGRGRPRKEKEATLEDATIFLNFQQKEGLSEPAIRSRGRPKKKNRVTEEHLEAPLKLDHQLEGLSELVKNLRFQHQNKKLQRRRPTIQKEGAKDDEAIMSLCRQEQDGLCGRASDHHFESQNIQPRNNRKAQSPEKGAIKSGAAPSNLRCPEQGEFESASYVIPEASSTQSLVDLKESLPASSDNISRPDFPLFAIASSEASTCLADLSSQCNKDQNQPRRRSTRNSEAAKTFLDFQNDKQHDIKLSRPDLPLFVIASSEASTCLADQLSQRDKDQNQPRRRSTCKSEAAKTFLDFQNDKQHDLKLRDQRRLAKPMPALVPSDHHYPDEESVDSENEIHDKPVELEQAELPLDNETPQQGRPPPSKPLTRRSKNQHDQEQQEESHDHDQAAEKMEVQVKLHKEMTAKSAPIRVPLSSKDHLRSRIKRQS